MGSITRMNRNNRFVDAFEDEVVKNFELKPGDVLTVKQVSLGEEDEETHIFVHCTDPNGQLHEFSCGMIFDPDNSTAEDMIERLAAPDGLTELDEETVKDKLHEADLFDL